MCISSTLLTYDSEAIDGMKEHLQAIVTVLSLVYPLVCGAMFARIEGNRSRAELWRMRRRQL